LAALSKWLIISPDGKGLHANMWRSFESYENRESAQAIDLKIVFLVDLDVVRIRCRPCRFAGERK
jgi:hypothetical protein